ncbi:Uncharacterized protein Fot_27499 [Forsythia ovata]|uniref:Uncharacterized protein n=1 Tax=Forsythia ovata TaxID=205694 RepID=A0ABD1TLU2_9LAMI
MTRAAHVDIAKRLDQAHSSSRCSIRNQLGRLTFSPSPNNSGPSLLFRLGHHELGPLCLLLSHLLLLHGPGELSPIRQVSNCHIIQNNVEILRPAYQTLSNEGRHMRTLCEQLVRIKLSNNSFKNFVSDR